MTSKITQFARSVWPWKSADGTGGVKGGTRMSDTATATPAYNTVPPSRRISWSPTSASVNTLSLSNANELMRQARDLGRKNPWAAHALDVFVGDAIGAGIMPICKHSSAAVKDRFDEAFLDWTDYCDVIGSQDFYGLQAQVLRATMQDGECFVRIRRRKSDVAGRRPVGLRLQVLESDYVPLTMNQETLNGNSIRQGIEFNADQEPVAYHMYKSHPGDLGFFNTGETIRVPADEVIHCFRPIRPGQIRGITWFAPAMSKLFDLDKCDDAALLRMQIANMMTLFIKKPAMTSGGPLNEEVGGNGDGTAEASLESGATIYLQEGEEPVPVNPPDTGDNYDPFVRSQLMAVGVALSMTYDKLTGDQSKNSYSSGRLGHQGYWRFVETIQHNVIIFQFCRRIMPVFLEEAALGGVLAATEVRNFKTPVWQPPAAPPYDPKKDTETQLLKINGGLSSRTRECATNGANAEEIDRENATDRQRAAAAGIQYETKPGRQQQQQPPPAERRKQKEVVQ